MMKKILKTRKITKLSTIHDLLLMTVDFDGRQLIVCPYKTIISS